MASQPANSTIGVQLTVRAYRQDLRHESVKNITDRLRPLVMSVPGQETLTVPGTRLTPTDMSPYMGEARATATRGIPVTIGARAAVAFNVVEHITGVAIPFTIGSDKFVSKETAALAASGDLHQDLRNLA